MGRYRLRLTDGTLEVVTDSSGFVRSAVIVMTDGTRHERAPMVPCTLDDISASIRAEAPDRPLTENWKRIESE
jgi:hypothetical protein